MSTSERVMPLFISSKNAEGIVGQSWRWVRDYARAVGIPVHRANGKSFIEAAEFVRSIRSAPTPPVDPSDELAAMRTVLGKRRRAA